MGPDFQLAQQRIAARRRLRDAQRERHQERNSGSAADRVVDALPFPCLALEELDTRPGLRFEGEKAQDRRSGLGK